jgi:2-polyprenyl-3-methyl-5-hydroxy-6-metoxy-1,4-benzoquinol methylase
MSRSGRSLLSEEVKQYLARIQGADNRARPYDYGELTSKETGNFVKYALAAAEEILRQRTGTTGP